MNMIRRAAQMAGWIPLAVFAWVLSAGPAAAQNRVYSVWAHRHHGSASWRYGSGWRSPRFFIPPITTYNGYAPFVAYESSGIESLYATYWWRSTLIQKNSAAAHGDGDYVGPYDLPADSKRQSALATLRRYGGGLDWPVGLRNMTPREETSDLREHIDSIVERLLNQPASDKLDPELVKELSANLDKVRKRFATYAADSAMTAQHDADARRFLAKIQDTISSLDDRPKLVTTSGN
jgi:hypothetical protein